MHDVSWFKSQLVLNDFDSTVSFVYPMFFNWRERDGGMGGGGVSLAGTKHMS